MQRNENHWTVAGAFASDTSNFLFSSLLQIPLHNGFHSNKADPIYSQGLSCALYRVQKAKSYNGSDSPVKPCRRPSPDCERIPTLMIHKESLFSVT